MNKLEINVNVTLKISEDAILYKNIYDNNLISYKKYISLSEEEQYLYDVFHFKSLFHLADEFYVNDYSIKTKESSLETIPDLDNLLEQNMTYNGKSS